MGRMKINNKTKINVNLSDRIAEQITVRSVTTFFVEVSIMALFIIESIRFDNSRNFIDFWIATLAVLAITVHLNNVAKNNDFKDYKLCIGVLYVISVISCCVIKANVSVAEGEIRLSLLIAWLASMFYILAFLAATSNYKPSKKSLHQILTEDDNYDEY